MKTFISGVPYCRNKNRGRIDATRIWTERVVAGCSQLPRVAQPCAVEIEFILPMNKYPKDFPYGPDLDNLLKRFLDAVQKSGALANDSFIVSLAARKRMVRDDEETGVHVEFRPLKGDA